MCHKPTKSARLHNNDRFHLNLLLGISYWKREKQHTWLQHHLYPHVNPINLKTRTKPPTPKDKLSRELVTSPPRKKSKTIFGSSINHSKRMRSEHVKMILEVGEEKNLMQ
jgi:hypothetical protein